MAVVVNPPGAKLTRPPRAVAARTVRKVALCGSHDSSLRDAPWLDPSWEFWGHASSHRWYPRPMDRYFDMHVKACWTRPTKKGHDYPIWLSQLTTPIYMQEHYPEVPASVRYPKGQVLTEFSYAHQRHYFTNHVAWMIALALTEGVTHLGLFGINYATESEYVRQRGSAEYWIGQADARGVAVHLPAQCSLLREPALLYGYESHDKETGLLKEDYKRKEWRTIKPITGEKGRDGIIEAPDCLKELIEQEDRDFPRPEWAKRPQRTDGGLNA